MELFQTIWTALTTENELLTKIILIPETFIETTVNMLLFTTLLNISVQKKRTLYYIITFSILSNLFNLLLPNPYKSFVNLFVLVLTIKFFFKTNLIKTILATILPIIVTVLCESIIVKFSDILLHINIINITTNTTSNCKLS